jgi:hypothetical protein
MNRTKAQELLRGHENFSRALELATEAFMNEDGLNIGDRLRTTISADLFNIDLSSSGGDGNTSDDLVGEKYLGKEAGTSEHPLEFDADRNPLTTGVLNLAERFRQTTSEMRHETMQTIEAERSLNRLFAVKRQLESNRLTPEDRKEAQNEYDRLFKILNENRDVLERIGQIKIFQNITE